MGAFLIIVGLVGGIVSILYSILFAIKKNKDKRAKGILSFILSAILIIVGGTMIDSSSTTNNKVETKDNSSKQTKTEETKKEVKQRQVQGKATDLGAGTFTVGKDIEEGLYDATPVDGQGNFIIQNAKKSDLMVNEILGDPSNLGVAKVRVKLVKDEEIQLSGINKTHFEPVTTAFVTEHKAISLHSGRWIVGEDVGSGRYVVTPKAGSGNFIVYKNGMPKVNEILGNSGVKQVTTNLDEGDIITIMSLNGVDFAPQN